MDVAKAGSLHLLRDQPDRPYVLALKLTSYDETFDSREYRNYSGRFGALVKLKTTTGGGT